MKNLVKKSIIVAGVVVVGIQFLPIGHARSNPPITSEITWSSAETRDLFMRACGDCHSNETRWPWYTNVAPVSWWIGEHVQHGRGTLNVSAWSEQRFGEEASESAETIREGSMPPANYLRLHPEARLSDAEAQRLIEGLAAMFGEHDD